MQTSDLKTVNIRYNHQGDGRWEMEYPAGNGIWAHQGNYPVLDAGNKQNVKITFTIVDSPGVMFRDDLSAISDVALTTGAGKPIPGTHSGILDKVQTKHGTELTIVDKNDSAFPLDINYILHFQNNIPDLDPIIRNGGGGDGSSSATSASLILGMAVAAVVATRRRSRA